MRVAVIADELLSIDGLEIDGKPVALRDEQRARLSREEVAAMLTMGVHFEAVLMSGFARQIAESGDLADPRVMYMLHEIGEEARHSRAFIRLIDELAPTAKNPLDTTIANFILNKLTRSLAKTDALLLVMVLAGRAPDLVDVERGESTPPPQGATPNGDPPRARSAARRRCARAGTHPRWLAEALHGRPPRSLPGSVTGVAA